MDLDELTALSAVDGRYRVQVAPLAALLSEFGLMKFRTRVECEWFLHLSGEPGVRELPPVDEETRARVRAVHETFDRRDAGRIKALEATTNHDVKAVEYFVKERLAGIDHLAPYIEFVHFGCTSEDINNLAYALMLGEARRAVVAPAMAGIVNRIDELAVEGAELAMLSRTHGQPASPTTMGKELANFAARLERQLDGFRRIAILGKCNGAVGNYNAHAAAYPDLDWPDVSARFVTMLGLEPNPYTTQIEPHDYIAEYCHALMRFNQVLLDFDRDIWGYIALGYFGQRSVAGETGSSTMPHKINPIDFENSEGNLGVASALLGHLADKLPVSRWQRDLSDSTVLRNFGSALGHTLIACRAAEKGISKLVLNGQRMEADLDEAWEVLAEAVQTVMRKYGLAEPYERLKAATRGRRFDARLFQTVVDELQLPDEAKRELEALTPATYLGFAARLARRPR